MAEALHLTQGEAGLIASANFLGYLAGALAAASPRLPGGSRAWLLAALATSAATTGAMAWADGMPAFMALRFIGGAASAYVLVLASALVLERLNAVGRGNLSAVHFSGVGTGITVSALLTWALAFAGMDWRALWLGGGLLSLAALPVVAAFVPAAPAPVAQQMAAKPAAADVRLTLLTLAYGLFGFGYVITITFIVVIVRGSPSAATMEPIFWLVIGLAAIPSVALWVAAGRRLGAATAFAIACVVEAAGVFASVAWPTSAGLFLAAALLGGTFMGLTALGLIAARNLARESAPTAGDHYRRLRPRPDRRAHRRRLRLRPHRQFLPALAAGGSGAARRRRSCPGDRLPAHCVMDAIGAKEGPHGPGLNSQSR